MDPYIGITDFMNYEQVMDMLKVFRKAQSLGSKRRLHVGVMMSYKTLHGIPSKWQDAFPSKEKIASIFFSNETYNCLHYADYTLEDISVSKSLTEAIFCCGVSIHALQLDMIWPEPSDIFNGVHNSRKQIEVILQVGKKAFEEIGDDPNNLVARLADYQGVIQRVLLDKSMGQGLGMDAVGLIPFVEAIKTHYPKLGIVVAGGLGPETMNLVEPLVKEFPDISIDAQGRLRPSGSALDPVDWRMAGWYLIEALQLFGDN